MFTHDLINKLEILGYVCIYDEYFQDVKSEPKIFEWSNNDNMEKTGNEIKAQGGRSDGLYNNPPEFTPKQYFNTVGN